MTWPELRHFAWQCAIVLLAVATFAAVAGLLGDGPIR